MSSIKLKLAVLACLVLCAVGLGIFALAQAGQNARDEKQPAPADAKVRDASWIMFLSHRSGENLLFRMRPDGSDVKSVFGGPLEDAPATAPGLSLYREPHWSRLSPDRRLFLSWAADVGRPGPKYGSPSHFMLYVGRLGGPGARVLAADSDESFAWSPDSKRLAFVVSQERPRRGVRAITSTRIVVLGVDGSREMTVLDKPGVWGVCDWSPDGKRLLLTSGPSSSLKYGGSDLIEYDLAGALAVKDRMPSGADWAGGHEVEEFFRVLTAGQKARYFSEGRYSPDGKEIATVLSRHLDAPDAKFDPKGVELAVLEVGTTKLRKIAQDPEGLARPHLLVAGRQRNPLLPLPEGGRQA